MANLQPAGVTQYRITKIAFDDIDVNLLRHKFKDGRIFGLLVEHLLEHRFRNVTRSSDAGTPYDILLTHGRQHLSYQCKVANWSKPSENFDLKPSSMKGTGRRYDRPTMERHLQSIDGFVLIDTSQMPDLTIWTMPVEVILDAVSDKGCSIKIRDCDQRVQQAKLLQEQRASTLIPAHAR